MRKYLESINIQAGAAKFQLFDVPTNLFYIRHQGYSIFSILLKVTLGVVVWMLQWFGNLVMEMPVGLPVVAQKGGEKVIRGGNGKNLLIPTSNLPTINQQEAMTDEST